MNVSEINGTTQVNLSMRKSVVFGKDSEIEIKNLKIGDIVKGTVQRITDFGVFIAIDNTSLVGLSRKPTAVSNETVDLKDIYSVGGRVQAKILGITGHKISLGLKSSYFNELSNEEEHEDQSESNEDEDGDEEENGFVFADAGGDSDEDIEQLIRSAALQSDSEDENDSLNEEAEGEQQEEDKEDDEEVDVESLDEADEGLPIKKQKIANNPPVRMNTMSEKPQKSLSVGEQTTAPINPFAPQANTLFWGPSFQPAVLTTQTGNESEDEEESSNDSGSDDDEVKGGKRKRNRNTAAQKAEEEIRKKEVILSDFLSITCTRMLWLKVLMNQHLFKISNDYLSLVQTHQLYGLDTCHSSSYLLILMLLVQLDYVL